MNRKYVKYSAVGESLDAKRLESLLSHKMGSLYVESAHLQKFYEYTQKCLKEAGDGNHAALIMVTQRKQTLENLVREFLSNQFHIKTDANSLSGKLASEACVKIAHENVLESKVAEWYLPLLTWDGETPDVYRHAANVALYSALIAAKLGLQTIEDIAVAGIVHDVGLASIAHRNDPVIYGKHPDLAVHFLANRKIELKPNVLRIILQHHERFNGRGFPRKTKGTDICLEAQVLGLIDEIDYKIALEEGKARITPREVLVNILQKSSRSAADADFDPALVIRVLDLFPENKHV